MEWNNYLLYGLYFLSVSFDLQNYLLGLTYLKKTYSQRINFQSKVAQSFSVKESCSSLDAPHPLIFYIIWFHIFYKFDKPIYVFLSESLVKLFSIKGHVKKPFSKLTWSNISILDTAFQFLLKSFSISYESQKPLLRILYFSILP